MFRFLSWYFLLLIPFIIYLFLRKRKNKSLNYPSIELLKREGLKKTYKHKISKYLIMFACISLVIALARPQSGRKNTKIKKEGIDIILTLDVSGSMDSVDFKPNRLEAAKKVIFDFVSKRTSDRIGLVVFGKTAYTQIPLTFDYEILKESILNLETPEKNKEGTAIGMGMAVSLNRLKKSNAKSKIIILVTDGENTAGQINPKTAMDLAKDMKIRTYTIGIGSGELIMPYTSWSGKTRYKKQKGGFDEELLKKIAKATNAKYFHAKEEKSLNEVFKVIDGLEKTKIDTNNIYQYRELYKIYLIIALLLISIALFFERILYIRIP